MSWSLMGVKGLIQLTRLLFFEIIKTTGNFTGNQIRTCTHIT